MFCGYEHHLVYSEKVVFQFNLIIEPTGKSEKPRGAAYLRSVIKLRSKWKIIEQKRTCHSCNQ